MQTVHLLVKGKVQGVFYRATAQEKAEQYGLKGWVRNTADGEVEMMVTGESENLDQFIGWCRNGPDRARVADVIITEKEVEHFPGFRVIR